VTSLAATLRDELSARPGVRVLDRGARRSGIVTFTVDGHDPADVKLALREHGVNVSVTNVGQQRFEPRGAATAVRASVHYYNTEDEVERLLRALPRPA